MFNFCLKFFKLIELVQRRALGGALCVLQGVSTVPTSFKFELLTSATQQRDTPTLQDFILGQYRLENDEIANAITKPQTPVASDMAIFCDSIMAQFIP